MMESPAGYPGFPDSPMEQDEAAYPCKGCGEVLHQPSPRYQPLPHRGAAPKTDNLLFYLDTRGRKGLRTWYVLQYGFAAMPVY